MGGGRGRAAPESVVWYSYASRAQRLKAGCGEGGRPEAPKWVYVMHIKYSRTKLPRMARDGADAKVELETRTGRHRHWR